MLLSSEDVQRFLLIEQEFKLFEKKNVKLSELVKEVQALISKLETTPQDIKESLQEKASVLELICESIEDGTLFRVQDNIEETIVSSAAALRNHVLFILEKYLNFPNEAITESAVLSDNRWFFCPKCTGGWESSSTTAMVVCAKCGYVSHNPRYQSKERKCYS